MFRAGLEPATYVSPTPGLAEPVPQVATPNIKLLKKQREVSTGRRLPWITPLIFVDILCPQYNISTRFLENGDNFFIGSLFLGNMKSLKYIYLNAFIS